MIIDNFISLDPIARSCRLLRRSSRTCHGRRSRPSIVRLYTHRRSYPRGVKVTIAYIHAEVIGVSEETH